ncbi:MAG TPA: hypothetical protein GX742_02055 [Acholeplasmataceae bacterium]|nr:hypothetical protein [Acholeplasmataceae bacterium]
MNKLLGNFLNIIIGSILVWVLVYFLFYNPEPIVEQGPEDEIIVELFGEGAIVTLDAAFTPSGVILGKEDVTLDGNVVGYSYHLKGTGEYFNAEGSIEFKFLLDIDFTLLGFIEVEYGHTGGGYRANTLTFIRGLVGTSLVDFEDLDEETGSTASTNLLTDMLMELKALLA